MLELLIEGSRGDHYAVTFARDQNNLRTSCSCAAGRNGTHCKHRLALLDGDFTKLVGDTPPDIGSKLAALLSGSDVEKVLEQLRVAEVKSAAAQAELKRVKKALDRAMQS